MKKGNGYVRLNPEKLYRASLVKGWTQEELSKHAALDPRTVGKMLRGEPVRLSSATQLVKTLGIEEILSVVVDGSSNALESRGMEDGQAQPTELDEWRIERALTEWTVASNGLKYRVHLLRHHFLPDALSRGKCYDLSELSTKDDERIRERLLRHPKVCRKLGPHPQIPVNERTFPDEGGKLWWVIDRWVSGQTLEEGLSAKLVEDGTRPRIMREIAEGLCVLHRARIIRRELSPRSVWLRESDGSVLLTDFELAKLFDGSPTVSHSWPDEPYRAPEVGTEQIDVRADLYSWGRIFVRLVAGELPARGKEREALSSAHLPASVREIVCRVTAVPPSSRPDSIDQVLTALGSWT